MRRFRDIIEDIKAPSVQDLWLNGGKLKYYGEKGWQDIKGQDAPTVKWDDIDDKPKSFTPSSHTHTKSDITDFPTLAAVATSGSYNDLSNKPTIPSAYILPIASASALGGVKSATTGTTSERDYNVQVNSDGTMKVNVPWVNTDTTYNMATSLANGLMSAADKSKLDNIASNANNYTLPNASTSVRGGVLRAVAVTDLAGTEDAAAICAKVNALLSALRASGALQL